MSDIPAPPEPPVAGLMRLQTVFTDYTNLPENRFVHTWHVQRVTGGVYATSVAAAAVHLIAFYQAAAAPSTNAVGKYLAPMLNRAYTIRCYDLSVPAGERVPTVVNGTLPAATQTGNLPAEVAVCASFTAAEPLNPSKRGRIYLGPLVSDATTYGSATDFGSPNSTFISAINNALKKMVDGMAADPVAGGITLCIYSRKNDATYPVKKGWVDNAFDTQRRRGHRANARYSWVAA